MRIEIFRQFASPEECRELASWAEAHQGTVLRHGKMRQGLWEGRLTSRNASGRPDFPLAAYRIMGRVWTGFAKPRPPPELNGGYGGMLVVCHRPGSDTATHLDSASASGKDTLRCNLLVQPAQAGGVLTVEGQVVPLGLGDLHCYVVTRHHHAVSMIEGNRPRILWLFGFGLDGEAWDEGRIDYKQPVQAD